MTKIKTTVNLTPELVFKAKDMKLNVSQYIDKCLSYAIGGDSLSKLMEEVKKDCTTCRYCSNKVNIRQMLVLVPTIESISSIRTLSRNEDTRQVLAKIPFEEYVFWICSHCFLKYTDQVLFDEYLEKLKAGELKEDNEKEGWAFFTFSLYTELKNSKLPNFELYNGQDYLDKMAREYVMVGIS